MKEMDEDESDCYLLPSMPGTRLIPSRMYHPQRAVYTLNACIPARTCSYGWLDPNPNRESWQLLSAAAHMSPSGENLQSKIQGTVPSSS